MRVFEISSNICSAFSSLGKIVLIIKPPFVPYYKSIVIKCKFHLLYIKYNKSLCQIPVH